MAAALASFELSKANFSAQGFSGFSIDEFLTEILKDGISPAKAGLTRVDAFYWWFIRLDNVIFFQENSMLIEPIQVVFDQFYF